MNWVKITDRQYEAGPYVAIVAPESDHFVAQIYRATYDIEPVAGTAVERLTAESALAICIREFDHWARCPELGLGWFVEDDVSILKEQIMFKNLTAPHCPDCGREAITDDDNNWYCPLGHSWHKTISPGSSIPPTIAPQLWLYCFQCRTSQLHTLVGMKYKCPNCGMTRAA